MFQGKGQTIVYSSQLDDGFLHHHPVAVLEGSGACHKKAAPARTVPLPLPSAQLPGSLPWLAQRHSSLLSVVWTLARTETLSPLGRRGEKAAPPTLCLTPRMHRSSNTSFPHRAHLHPHKVPLGHKPPTQRAMKGPGDKIRPPHAQKPKPAGKSLTCLPGGQLAGAEPSTEPLPRKSHSPALPHCPGDSHT